MDLSTIHPEGGAYSGEAIIKLAKYENFQESLLLQQGELVRQMDALRMEGKTNTVKFKQLLANKLTTANILILLKSYGLD